MADHKPAGGAATDASQSDQPPSTNNRIDSQAALPPGTLRTPFFGRHGDEQRSPTVEEDRKRKEFLERQNDQA
jgi:hypothetical protein